jgi:ATP-binding cassette subfamily B protein/subfamily B ATP-binding cassette protein MsbA
MLKDFTKIMRQYAAPYKGHLAGAVVLNILSAVFNIFSFALLVPILNILFRVDNTVYEFIPWDSDLAFKDKAINNFYYYVSDIAATYGAGATLFMLAGIMIFFTALKTSCYFGSNAVMIPISTGIVKELRCRIYNRILSLPIGFFTEERKGDIVARITGDVSEVENSILASISMLIKDPILIVIYFGFLTWVSPEMMAFTIVFAPAFVWVMGLIGKQLKRSSLEAQALWSDTMSQVDETLGGLRVIKAFNAEKTMRARFQDITDRMRRKIARVSTRQATAHPVSEFLGTVMLMIVLCVGGVMIINGKGLFGQSNFMDASTFIYFLVILYSVIEPIKELSRAAYGVRKGLASMERINKVLEAENPIKDPAQPKPLTAFEHSIRLEDVSFSYDGSRQILDHVNLEIPRGKMIAIVGESGAGKSTLVDLIPRFWDVTGGRITIDGKDLRE